MGNWTTNTECYFCSMDYKTSTGKTTLKVWSSTSLSKKNHSFLFYYCTERTLGLFFSFALWRIKAQKQRDECLKKKKKVFLL